MDRFRPKKKSDGIPDLTEEQLHELFVQEQDKGNVPEQKTVVSDAPKSREETLLKAMAITPGAIESITLKGFELPAYMRSIEVKYTNGHIVTITQRGAVPVGGYESFKAAKLCKVFNGWLYEKKIVKK